MIKTVILTLALVVGLLAAAGGLYAVWAASGVMEDIQGLENEIYKQRAENARTRAGEEGEKKIADSQQQIEKKTIVRNTWFGVAAGALIIGLPMALISFLSLLTMAFRSLGGKRGVSVPELTPAPDA